MALLTLHRLPSISTAPDESFQRRGRLQKRESFALIKGAVLLLDDGDSGPLKDDVTSPVKKGTGASAIRHRHLHAMLEQLRPEDTIRLAVELESVSTVRVRYLIVVSTLASRQENILLGMDFPSSDSDHCTIGLVLPVWSDTQVYLDGDGGFSVTSAVDTRNFKPVSMQTMCYSVLCFTSACSHIYTSTPIVKLWVFFYLESSADRISNERLIKEHLRDIMMTEDLDNLTSKMVHIALESRIGFDMRPYKEYIDNEILVTMAQMDKPSKIFDYLYLGSEWNAANFEELQKNNVGYILNVTKEIDNFFPESFTYMNIRVYDVEATDLLAHWPDTYNFIDSARKSGQAVLVHCKMGVSRSASTVIAYAMKQQRWSLDEALTYVRDCRSIIKPNEGFLKQLQTYSGILNASQQRHSALWKARQKSVRKDKSEQDSKPGEANEDEDEDDDEEEEEEDEDHVEGSDEEEISEEDQEVILRSGRERANTNVASGDVASSVNRSGRMNLFSLMQSISEMDDGEKGHEQLPGSPRRSPNQRRRSQGRRGLAHQKACVDVSPEPRSLPDGGQSRH
uniref:protein-serine/threonine phosphatase n=1 Tax=Fundulus heteroclitus TaxID=8078 RepID=A0A3Q2Q1A5_FUNHE